VEDATVIFRSEAPQQVNLGDAFAAGVLPTWTESVALTRAIAWQLYREGSTAPVPDLGDIALFSTGAIHLEGGDVYSDGQVAGVGAVMGQLLEHVSAPPQVMDVQRQALAVPPVYATLMEFHNALDFFARPDSKAVLVDYHSRATAALAQTETNQALEELKEKTKAAPPKEQKKKKKPERKKVPAWVIATAALLVVSLGGAAALYVMGGPSPESPVRQSANAALTAISEAGQKVQDATTNVVSKLIGGASATPSNESPANASPATPPAPPVVAKRQTAAAPATGNAAATQPPSAAATAASGAAVPSSGAAAPSSGTATPSSGAAVPSPAPSTAAPTPEMPPPATVDTGVYTAKSPDVAAPELVYPQLPTKPFSDGTTNQPGELDLLVLEDGTVGEVRLVPESNRLQDRMMVSAAKAWRFRPAQKNGLPVRYRMRIPITW
jgi:cytoskeletal protein RodZ